MLISNSTTRIPVKYVFGNFPIDVDHCCESFNNKFSYDKNKEIIILFDVLYHYKIGIYINFFYFFFNLFNYYLIININNYLLYNN